MSRFGTILNHFLPYWSLVCLHKIVNLYVDSEGFVWTQLSGKVYSARFRQLHCNFFLNLNLKKKYLPNVAITEKYQQKNKQKKTKTKKPATNKCKLLNISYVAVSITCW